MEHGRQTPTMAVVNRLARGCGITLAEFYAPFDQPFHVRSREARRDDEPVAWRVTYMQRRHPSAA